MSTPSKAPEAPETEPLTDMERQFCLEYLIDLNRSAAARRAGYSLRSARQLAHKLYRQPRIRAEIDRLMAERARRTEITADRVLRELEQLAFSDVRNFRVSDSGKLTVRGDAESIASRAVQSIKRVRRVDEDGITTTTIELRLWSKPEALRLAMQHLGMLRQVVDVRDRTLEDLLRNVPPVSDDENAA